MCCPPHASSRGGVFTFTSLRYDDGRRDLHLPLSTHFRERVREYNRVVFDNGEMHTALCADIKEVSPEGFDLVYLDPLMRRREMTTATSSATTSSKG